LAKRSISIGLLIVCGALVSVTTAVPQARTPQAAPGPFSVIQENCLSCHSSTAKMGGLALDTLSPDRIAEDAQTWEAVIRKLRGGLMPPVGAAKRPDTKSVNELISWLETKIDTTAHPPAGRVALHRLNRREYANVMRDLLGLEVDVKKLLPLDDVKGHFDNDATSLQVSPSFIDQYVSAAREVAKLATGDVEAPGVTITYGDIENMVISLNPKAAPGTGRQQHHIEGMPFGTRGGFTVKHNFPADGDYELTIGDMALAREVPKMEFENTVLALLDGKEFYRTNVGGERDHKAIDTRLDVAVAEINGRLRKIPFKATAGQHDLTVTFLHRSYAESDERVRSATLEGGQERVQAAHALQIKGPLAVTGLSDSPSRKKIFTCKPKNKADETPCARKIVTDLARRAFRRPVTDQDVNPLMAFYTAGYANGDFERGVRDAVTAVLASPHFLYRAETANPQGGVRTLSDVELASRLSFFLWSSMPDDELLDLAIKSQLSKPDVLAKQVRRMLADERAKTLVTDFSFQWLNLAKLDEIAPDSRQFPHASGLNDSRKFFKEELELFIDSILRSDRSVVDLLTADHTFVNERLGGIYGMENVKGFQFRRVTLPDTTRHGLLGKAAILNLTANPNRTSPVLRGAWILDRLMGTPPAPPPPNVEALSENRAGQPAKTVRERIEQHRSKPACMGCHAVMDPLGFALENFDTIGQFRTLDAGNKIDPTGVLPDGTALKGPEDLRRALTARPDQFVQALTENLFTYALGRSADYRDMPAVRKIVHSAEADKYRFESLVMGIVSSDAFRKREAPSTTTSQTVAK
jgi:mono/diheme cytochrome c family protein